MTTIADDIHAIARHLSEISGSIKRIANAISVSTVVGIQVTPGSPTTHSFPKENSMAKPKISCMKASAQKAKAKSAAAPGPVQDYVFLDNEDNTMTVQGVDAVGNPVDISSLATLSPPPTSSDPSVVTVDAPTGMKFAMHAVGKLSTPGTPVQITTTATWNDGSKGPFTFTLPVDVTSGGATGIQIVPGTPTVR